MRFLPVVLLVLLAGCPRAPVSPIRSSIPAVGGSIEKSVAYAHSADSGAKAAIPHADATGKSLLALVGEAHLNLFAALADARTENAEVLSQWGDLEDYISALADQDRAKLEAEKEKTRREHDLRLKDEASLGFRLQKIVHRLLVIFGILLAIHYLARVASWLPPPTGPIAGLVARLIDPLGWIIWLCANLKFSRTTTVPA